MKSLGICVGASTVSTAVITPKQDGYAIETISIPHEGNPRKAVLQLIDDLNLGEIAYMAATGRKFRSMLKLQSIPEPEALEHAFSYIKENAQMKENPSVIVSAGGETFMVYEINDKGRIIDVYTGNKCASGTGEFFLQQLKRMDLNIEEAIAKADVENPYKVAGRCSVFCKSDCTHALNKGAPKESVVAGLCEMMAGKIIELLKKSGSNQVMLVGGTSDNSIMVEYLKRKGIDVIIPEHASSFEALGSALWAMASQAQSITSHEELFLEGSSSFKFLSPLKDFVDKVTFESIERKQAAEGDQCIVGLDVGSTTTKAVLLRTSDDAILASCYLRTNGDPVGAARRCYQELQSQLSCPVTINGLGVTGSGRQIAGLHALTTEVINEIIAHATAAAYFDPEVDTIFEIGGQDAKYTYLTNGVPSDYAMNEACSAGTGSFLEEAAKESLNITTEQIGDIAMESSTPPNFNDQCAAFIGSDIKTAIQTGLEVKDIAAGLVYSVCMNYMNRVKSSRAVGGKVFMQGGVCYNKAVPIAMAALTGKEIIVPPEPGLMGAFGVALEVKNKLAKGLAPAGSFDLGELAGREVSYGSPFTCAGGKEKCDRKCIVNRINIAGKVYPFGGACNKYYNMLGTGKETDNKVDYVALRQKLVFDKYSVQRAKVLDRKKGKTVGINNSLLTNSLYPLYHNFFTALGYDVVLSDGIDKDGVERKGSAFCYPVEISHGAVANLMQKRPDIIFLPHVKAMNVPNGGKASVTCPFVQAEPYYLKSAFEELGEFQVISPVLDFTQGLESQKAVFAQIGRELDCSEKLVELAYEEAVAAQKAMSQEFFQIGEQLLADLEKNPQEAVVVTVGRPYNAFASCANMGIPQKFASRGYTVVPIDFLPYYDHDNYDNMYWAMGQIIVKSAKLIAEHKQLFGVYISNFSCGPDSFVISYFREIMKDKPSLTLELDSHTADAGVDTRIEAFLDVVKGYMRGSKDKEAASQEFIPGRIVNENNKTYVIDSKGDKYPIDHPRVHVLVPSMGDIGSKLLAATLRHVGVRAEALQAPAEKELQLGRGLASCKECLPLMLTIGSLKQYLDHRKDQDEILVYFMPETSGPCRFGQYNVLMKSVVNKLKLENIVMLSLTAENSYAGFGTKFALRAWHSIIISDALDDIYSALLVMAKDKDYAIKIYNEVCDEIVSKVETASWGSLLKTLQKAAAKLKAIPVTKSIHHVPKAALIGEIYVRRDGFSRQYLIERLAQKGILVKTSPIAEWIYYCDYIVKNRLVVDSKTKDVIKSHIMGFFKNPFERTIKKAFEASGLYESEMLDVDHMIKSVSDLVSPRLTGETILTVGAAITEVVEQVEGIISIGPFGCMPGRIAEAIISETINQKKLEVAKDKELVEEVLKSYPNLPFLSIETDGSIFPQVIEARLETFCLQVYRMHELVSKIKKTSMKA